MGAAFAVQVMTGKENNVKKLMDWAFGQNEQAQNWVKAVHTLASSTQRVIKSGLGKVKEKPLMPGYVFIEMNYSSDSNNQSAYLPADLWHLIKGIPGVIRQFTGAGQIIGAEVFEEMFGKVDEDLVEVAVPVVEKEGSDPKLVQAEKNVQCALHGVNTAHTPNEKKLAEEQLDQAVMAEEELLNRELQPERGPVAENLEELKQTVTATQASSILSKAKAFMKNQKEIIQLNKQLFLKYAGHLLFRDSSDPTSVSTLIQTILQALKQEVMRE